MRRQIILDTETTGLYAENGDRLVEFAGLEMVNRQMTGRFLHLYVHPERDMPEEAARVHGLTIDVLEEKNAPPFAKVGQEISEFIRGAELIIHNAKFDVGFLNAEFARVGLPNIDSVCTVVDTLEMARKRYPGQKNSLDALCTRLDVDRSRRVLHGALIGIDYRHKLIKPAAAFGITNFTGFIAQRGKQHARPAFLRFVFKGVAAAPLSAGKLKVQAASEEECAAHENYLDGLDKAAGGSCIYRQSDNPN